MMLYHLEYFITGIPSNESKRMPGLITELNRVINPEMNDWDTFEVKYSNVRSTVFDKNADDLVVFTLGVNGLGVTATHLLHEKTDMTFAMERLPTFKHITLYVDSRLSTCENLAELIRNLSPDIDASKTLDQLPKTRQVLALRETCASMFNVPLPEREKHALKRYYTEKDKDGNPVRLHVILKGNLGK